MKNLIAIIHAENNNQHCIINCQAYEFEFNAYQLSKCICKNLSTKELEEESEMDSSDNNKYDMAKEVASYWLHKHVEMLIQEYVGTNPKNLIDHLQQPSDK